MNQLFDTYDYGSKLQKWVYIAIIMATEDPEFSEVAKLHRRRGIVEFRLKIPYFVFARAPATEQRRMVLYSRVRSVDQMSSIGVADLNAEQLKHDQVHLGHQNGWR